MRAILHSLAAVLGVVLAAVALAGGSWPHAAGVVDVTVGAVVLITAAAGLRWPRRWTSLIILVAGLVPFAVGTVGWFAGWPGSPGRTVLGLLLAAVGTVAWALPTAAPVHAVDKDGRTLAEIKSIQQRDDLIAMKAVLLGSMPATIYVSPAELWKFLGLLDTDVALRLPGALAKGWWRSRG